MTSPADYLHWSRHVERVMSEPRVCRDCGGTFYYSTTHDNWRYCPVCLPQHPRKCATCKQEFYPQIDTDRLCPVHTVHPVLFGKDALP